jgi:hypothetical protein
VDVAFELEEDDAPLGCLCLGRDGISAVTWKESD